MKKLASVLGLSMAAGLAASAAASPMIPEYSEKDATVITFEGDFVQHRIGLNGKAYDVKIPVITSLFQGKYLFLGAIPTPYTGDVNGDGKFDWKTTMTIVDRNHDGKPDMIKVLATCGGKYFKYLKSNKTAEKDFRGVAVWVDDDFDGRLDRYITDCLNKNGVNDPDGRWDDETRIESGRKIEDMIVPRFFYIKAVEEAPKEQEMPKEPDNRLHNQVETFEA